MTTEQLIESAILHYTCAICPLAKTKECNIPPEENWLHGCRRSWTTAIDNMVRNANANM